MNIAVDIKKKRFKIVNLKLSLSDTPMPRWKQREAIAILNPT